MSTKKPIILAVQSPLHVGTGTRLAGSRISFAPCVRDEARAPIVPSSTLSGALARRIASSRRKGGVSASPISIDCSSAEVALFPFRTARGVFVWGTTASRLGRLLLSVRAQASVPATLPVTRTEVLVSETFSSAEGGELFLEEYAFRAVKHGELSVTLLAVANAVFGEQDSFFRERLLNGTALLSDESFAQLLEVSTELAETFPVDAATKRSQGRVDTIECLPAETVLIAEVSESAELEPLRPYAVQLGARQRVGHGICRITMFGEATQ